MRQAGKSADDAEIASLLLAARTEAEAITRRTLRQSVTRRHELRHWPGRRWDFLAPPLHHTPAVTVEHYDSGDTLQTVASSNYEIEPTVSSGHVNEGVSSIVFKPDYTLPALSTDRGGTRVIITYTTGWGDWDALSSELRGMVEIARTAIKIILYDNYNKSNSEENRKRARDLLGALAFGSYA